MANKGSPQKTKQTSTNETGGWLSLFGLVAGPLAFALLLALPATPEGLPVEGHLVAALGMWMALWWITEAIPIPATALLPLVVLPVSQAQTLEETATPYAHPIIFLFLGGFLLAAAMQASGLHRRIALAILAKAGGRPPRLLGGFMLATALLSMGISNTATSLMMLPIALSLIDVFSEGKTARKTDPESVGRFASALMLGIAYAASIGGIATIVGSPPNALAAAFIEQEMGFEISFARWLAIGLPVTVVFLPLTWFFLSRVGFRLPAGEIAGGEQVIEKERNRLGRIKREETLTALVFGGVAFFWITKSALDPWLGTGAWPDAAIALTGALILFAVPLNARGSRVALDWDAARNIPFGILFLFGGGLSLAQAITTSGLADYLGTVLGNLPALSAVVLILIVAAVTNFLTEITSNTATTAAFLPLAAVLAESTGVVTAPVAVTIALSASCAFMLPVATPPNAVVYGSGRLPMRTMVKTGFVLNLVAIGLITAAVINLTPLLFPSR